MIDPNPQLYLIALVGHRYQHHIHRYQHNIFIVSNLKSELVLLLLLLLLLCHNFYISLYTIHTVHYSTVQCTYTVHYSTVQLLQFSRLSVEMQRLNELDAGRGRRPLSGCGHRPPPGAWTWTRTPRLHCTVL